MRATLLGPEVPGENVVVQDLDAPKESQIN